MAGGGVGEAMLIGAAVGAGTGGIMSAVQDKDPLEGALLGAAMGAAGGGIGSGIGGMVGNASTTALEGASSLSGTGFQNALGQAMAQGGEQAATSSLIGQAGSSATQLTPSITQAALGGGSNVGAIAGQGGMSIPGVGTAGGSLAGSGAGAVPSAATGATTSGASSGLGQGLAPHLTNAQAYGAGAGGGIMGLVGNAQNQGEQWAPEQDPYTGSLSYFKYSPQTFTPSRAPGYADGGITALGPQTGMYPQSQIPDRTQFAVPTQMPASREVIGSDYDRRINPYTGDMMMASGGISSLGSYSDGGRMLKGPGDGMSDDIPGVIAGKQPARLADGEFVVPADVVSHLGNGSTDAGAKKLYSMMDNVRKARTGSKKQGRQIKSEKYIPGMAEGGRVKHYSNGNLVVQDGQIGYYDDGGNFNQLSSSQAPSLGIKAPTQGFSGSRYDPNYYNPQYYQNQLPGLQQKYDTAAQELASVKALPGFDANYYLNTYQDIANDRYWSAHPHEHYMKHGISEGRSPFEGGVPGGQLQSAELTAEYQKRFDEAQRNLAPVQQNLERLANSDIAYTPYTTSGRPSAAEPQFYGNIYRPEYTDYAAPGYNMNELLGGWSNMAGYEAPTSQVQQNIANLAGEQRAAQQQSLENAQIAAQTSRQMINESVAAGENKPPQEEKKRSGGIASLRRA